jgi:hypothetical protein
MDETPFIALMDDDGAKRFVNIRQIVMLEAIDHGISLAMSDGSKITVAGRGAAQVLKLIVNHSMAPDGTPLRGLIKDTDDPGGATM